MEAQKEFAFPHSPIAQVPGMTLRDWFAALALQGLLANRQFHLFCDDGVFNKNLAAQNSYRLADAMMDARNLAYVDDDCDEPEDEPA